MDRGMFIELGCAPPNPTRPLAIERPDKELDFHGFARQRASSVLPGCIVDVPTCGDKAEESVTEAQRGFDRKMREIVEHEERSLTPLVLLPRDRPVAALTP